MTAPAIVEAKTTALAATPTGRMAVADIIGHAALILALVVPHFVS